jgi:hypothetical protein
VLATNDHHGEPEGEADCADLIRKYYLSCQSRAIATPRSPRSELTGLDVVTRQPIAPNGGYRSLSGEQSELQSVKGTRQRLAPDRRLAKVSHLRLRRAGMCPDRPVLRVGQWSGNFMAADKRGQCCRLARYCGYVSRSVGDVVSFGQVEQDEDVAERVCDDGHPADRDVEGLDAEGGAAPSGIPPSSTR